MDAWPLGGGVEADTLYRYDEPFTRRVKMALNYQLDYEQTRSFIDPLFAQVLGPEEEMCRKLYLSCEDLCGLSAQADIMFHGREHRLWAELDVAAHREELTPPTPLDGLLSDRYILSIPYGMVGAYDPDRIIQDAGRAMGAFTMDRTLAHQQTCGGFWWLHRYDQADVFDAEGNVRCAVLEELLAHAF